MSENQENENNYQPEADIENKNNTADKVYTDKEYEEFDEFLSEDEYVEISNDENLKDDDYYVIPKNKITIKASQKTYNGLEADISDEKVHNIQNIRATADKAIILYTQGKIEEVKKIIPNFTEDYENNIKTKNGNIYISSDDYEEICNEVMENIDNNLHKTNRIKAIENGKELPDDLSTMSGDYLMATLLELGERACNVMAKDKNISLKDATNLERLKQLVEDTHKDFFSDDENDKFILDYVKKLSSPELCEKIINIMEHTDSKDIPELEKSIDSWKKLKQELQKAAESRKKKELGEQKTQKTNTNIPLKQQMKNASEQYKNNKSNIIHSDFICIKDDRGTHLIAKEKYEKMLKDEQQRKLLRQEQSKKQLENKINASTIVKNDATTVTSKKDAERILQLRGIGTPSPSVTVKRKQNYLGKDNLNMNRYYLKIKNIFR